MPDIRAEDVRMTLDVLLANSLSEEDLRQVLINRVPGIGGRISGLLEFLIRTKIIAIDDAMVSTITSIDIARDSSELVKLALSNNEIIADFATHCKSVQLIDRPERNIVINSAHTSRSFIWFLLFLEEFGVIRKHHKPLFIVELPWHEFFNKFIISTTEFSAHSEHAITPEQFEDIQRKRKEVGLLAERFVMGFESKRLANHPLVDRIKHVALHDVSAGYDILSFESSESLVLDRHIEVKSWEETRRFYFSKNEHNKAAELRESYFIYFVDRAKFNQPNYQPEIIKNPIKNIFQSTDGWTIEPDGWVISK